MFITLDSTFETGILNLLEVKTRLIFIDDIFVRRYKLITNSSKILNSYWSRLELVSIDSKPKGSKPDRDDTVALGIPFYTPSTSLTAHSIQRV